MLAFHVPKKQKRTEAEVHAMIVQDSKMRFGCADFLEDDSVPVLRGRAVTKLGRGQSPGCYARCVSDLTTAFKPTNRGNSRW